MIKVAVADISWPGLDTSGMIAVVSDNGKPSPPPGYQEPFLVWMVEWTDERDPGSRYQAGAFTTETEAQRLREELGGEGYGEMWINLVPVHQTVDDWMWDR